MKLQKQVSVMCTKTGTSPGVLKAHHRKCKWKWDLFALIKKWTIGDGKYLTINYEVTDPQKSQASANPQANRKTSSFKGDKIRLNMQKLLKD